jgi:hypothetical protein
MRQKSQPAARSYAFIKSRQSNPIGIAYGGRARGRRADRRPLETNDNLEDADYAADESDAVGRPTGRPFRLAVRRGSPATRISRHDADHATHHCEACWAHRALGSTPHGSRALWSGDAPPW